ncbi:LVIVD repeat-containing protein [Lewinella sp. IMCC34183]|uniref:LVIVD repeat-containing protein n=1 Tax=Lewinella sp. IMCC34183 TaxID=2248762 RepID=UPI000E27AA6A|nr:hypothetical protein [Lewinella sp. IMCC34183]
MKHPLLALLPFVLLLTGCLEETCDETITYVGYEPILLSAAEWRNDDFPELESESVCNPGAFYVYGDLLFILDQGEGLHIFDNADNANPRPLKFIPVKGGTGLAVRNGILYVNQFVDMLAFDLSDPASPEFLSRTEDVLRNESDYSYGYLNAAGGDILLGYAETTETREVSCGSLYQGRDLFLEDDLIFFAFNQVSSNAGRDFSVAPLASGAPGTVGIGGSLARFTISGGNLYVVSESDLRTFSLADATAPALVATTDLGWGIETIFPYKDMLFLGSQTGMLIYGIDNPAAPEHLSTFQHVLSCDPVVVQDDIAYVTMWGGSECGARGDQLTVIDVANPRSPRELQSVPMSNSHGLGVDGDKLFLCSGEEGLKVFDLTDEGLLGDERFVADEFSAKDVIVLPAKRELIVLGWQQGGIRQYDYASNGKPTYAGAINVCDGE